MLADAPLRTEEQGRQIVNEHLPLTSAEVKDRGQLISFKKLRLVKGMCSSDIPFLLRK